jgi:sugar lactone lactonase YvrE
VAGNGTAGGTGFFDTLPAGIGGPATSVALGSPTGLAFDAAGNIYIADAGWGVIWKVAPSTGIITIAAGVGRNGPCSPSCGDGIAATSAYLYNPEGVAVDGDGNIYIADSSNYAIRKVTASTGIISTVAGNKTSGYSGDDGPATSAELGFPAGIALDSSGNIYIADTSNFMIRKVTASTGIITTVVGDGYMGYSGDGGPATSAELAVAYSVAVDTSGNIYIPDAGNNRVREVVASTGIILTVAGNGTYGFSGDGGVATNAQLGFPDAVALDTAGNIYIADGGDNHIRAVGPIRQGLPSLGFHPLPLPMALH